MMLSSIRVRLVLAVALIQTAGAAVAIRLAVRHERRQSYKVLDAGLAEHAATLQALVEEPEEQTDLLIFHRELLALPAEARFQVVDALGRRIGGSQHWTAPRSPAAGPRTLTEFRSGNERYRSLTISGLRVLDVEPGPHPVPPAFTIVYAMPTAPIEAQLREVEVEAALAGLVLLLLSMGATTWAVTRGMRPLNELAGRAAEIDAGQWTFRGLAESRRVPELLPLADALQHLTERLRAAFERERSFFADAAHEMKTAVAIVRSTLQVGLEAERTAPAYREELEAALADTGRLQALVAGMLDLARIEGAAAPRGPGDSLCEVQAQVEEVLRALAPMAAGAGVRLERAPASGPAWVPMREEELRLALMNVVENAIQYSRAGQTIALAATSKAQWCRVAVRDEGTGIAAEALPLIFERFYRGDASRARSTGGSGLGLSIARALVQNAGGTIAAESVLGQGSTFTLDLPVVEVNTDV